MIFVTLSKNGIQRPAHFWFFKIFRFRKKNQFAILRDQFGFQRGTRITALSGTYKYSS